MLIGINHLTLSVKNLDRSFYFYYEILGAKSEVRWANGAYFSVGSAWLCLSEQADHEVAKGYTHVAFTISAVGFEAFSARMRAHEVKERKANRSEGASLYILDPDGHQLEIHVGDLATRLSSLKSQPYAQLQWFS